MPLIGDHRSDSPAVSPAAGSKSVPSPGGKALHVRISTRQDYLILAFDVMLVFLFVAVIIKKGPALLSTIPWEIFAVGIFAVAVIFIIIPSILARTHRRSSTYELSMGEDGIFSHCHGHLVPWRNFERIGLFTTAGVNQLQFHLRPEHYGTLPRYPRRWSFGAVSFGPKAVVVSTKALAISRRDLYEAVETLSGMKIRGRLSWNPARGGRGSSR
ncbi:hypothetical protein ACFW16_19960 [Inquilinus sp. NPDC058860]|uniref:hypothetical protein n=1 Tax=Inquilinus sp. NPDC058860 TaxID=3346652 RepID=UPI0036B6C2C4